jgi:hydroxyacylglutathione hydrolase
MGGKEWIPLYTDVEVNNGDSITCGGVRLEAIHTPGHTPEHIMWLCYDEARNHDIPCLAFTGDLLFVGSVGRPDLLGEEQKAVLARQLYDSFFITLLFLPDFLEIYPGHGAGSLCGKGLSARSTTTLGYERLFNPALSVKSIEDWTHMITQDMPAAPINFSRLKKINVAGPQLLTQTKAMASAEPFIIDMRHPAIFAKSHIKGSINIPLGQSFCNWVSSVLGEDRPIELIAENITQLHTAIQNLQLIGFDHVIKQELWDERMMATHYQLETLPILSPKALKDSIQKGQAPYILDVRTSAEWNAGHIQGAHHIELGLLSQSLEQIPKDAHIHTICGSGMRASLAASYLKNHGYPNVINIEGGMAAWDSLR